MDIDRDPRQRSTFEKEGKNTRRPFVEKGEQPNPTKIKDIIEKNKKEKPENPNQGVVGFNTS